jgi:hypothetical protein
MASAQGAHEPQATQSDGERFKRYQAAWIAGTPRTVSTVANTSPKFQSLRSEFALHDRHLT